MLGVNIKRFRTAKGLTQEEMAVKLNVVRQTVSKWEKGLSVPDAQILIQIAQLLEVSVNQLLGIVEDNEAHRDLAEELVKVNEQLAKKNQREKLVHEANRKRGLILWMSFLAMAIALTVQNEIASVVLAGLCMLAAVIVLYRNLALLTSLTTDDYKLPILRITTGFNIGVLCAGIIVTVLVGTDVLLLSENQEKLVAMMLVSCVILFSGIVSPHLPYNRHTGLRLPWTVQDEETWNIAHRVLSDIAFPIVVLYIVGTLTIDNFEAVTLFAMITWIGVPGTISYLFFRKKMYGK